MYQVKKGWQSRESEQRGEKEGGDNEKSLVVGRGGFLPRTGGGFGCCFQLWAVTQEPANILQAYFSL